MLRGVVVIAMRGSVPMRRLMSAMSSASCGSAHLANSSAQIASNWWPRMPSGSSALSTVAMAPFGQAMRRSDGSKCAAVLTDFNPEMPSIMTARASLYVAPMRPMRCMAPLSTPSAIHSAPLRVFPAPRPPRNSQIRQSPCGAICSGRARTSQSPRRNSSWSSFRLSSAVSSSRGFNCRQNAASYVGAGFGSGAGLLGGAQ